MTKLKPLEYIFSVKKNECHNEIRILGLKISLQYCPKEDIEKVQKNYKKVIERLKNKPKSEKIRVLFLINDITKWKTKSLYNSMKASDDFEPIIALTLGDNQWELNSSENTALINNNQQYFNSQGIACIIVYNLEQEDVISLKKLNPDIIFYQQPYQLNNAHKPVNVSEFALTYYMPYYVPNYWIPSLYWLQNFHSQLFRYYQPSKEWANQLIDFVKTRKKERVKNIIGIGHTMLDEINNKKKDISSSSQYVIYAPHWSIKHPRNKNKEYYSTFLNNYKEILAYAKSHPEINWVFKPHPTLKYTLTKTNLMTEDEILSYYKEWEALGICSYDSNYIDLFINSKALITDCGSFTIEYFATGKPLIHLISKDCKVKPPKFLQNIYNSFYKVHNNKELYKVLDEILVKNNDYLKPEREKVLEEQTWLNTNCAEDILDDIRGTIYAQN